jgi:hypothetical protein
LTALVDLVHDSDEAGPGAIGFLSAVQRVIESARPSTEADLLCAAACQFLYRRHRAKTEDVRFKPTLDNVPTPYSTQVLSVFPSFIAPQRYDAPNRPVSA